MSSLKRLLSLLVLAVLSTSALGQEPSSQPSGVEQLDPLSPAEAAEALFLQRLNRHIENYRTDSPARAQELLEAVRQYQAAQAERLLGSLQLPVKPGPLTPEQERVLKRIESRYGDTEAGGIAEDRLSVHYRLLLEPDAQKALQAIGLGSKEDMLSEDQRSALVKLADAYKDTQAAHLGLSYLSADRLREADRELHSFIEEFLKSPGAPETIEEFANTRLDFALTLVESQREHRLQELAKNFPDTSAAGKARALLEELKAKRANSIALDAASRARSANYREYWDRVYPPRTRPLPETETPLPPRK